MATELITRTWCDACLSELDQRTDATHSEAVALGNARRTLDLCESHFDTLLAPVVDALKRYGNPVEPSKASTAPTLPPSKAGGAQCPRCPFTGPRSNLRAHLKKTHGMTAGEASRAMGGTVPCPEAGCDFMGMDGTGVAVHRRLTHGIRGKSAKANGHARKGDPLPIG